MKASHAAALALVGWYLMVPPLDLDWQATSGTLSNETTPLIRWDIVLSFDSVLDCEGAREVLWKQFEAKIQHKPAPGLPLTTAEFLSSRVYELLRAKNERAGNKDPTLQNGAEKAGGDVLANVASSSRCIASDDPRLKEK